MSNDELYKGMMIFQQGLSTYNQGKAVESATQRLAELNKQTLAKEERLQASNQIAQELASRLTAAGANPAQIAAASEHIAPSMGAQFQAKENAELQGKSQSFQAGENAKNRAHEMAMQKMKLENMGFKDEKKTAKELATYADKFRKENKDTLDSREKMSALKGILDKTPDRVGVEMAKTGLLKFAGEDRVSDTDVARAQRDPSLRAGIARKLKLEATGEALADDRKFYQMILNHAETKMTETLNKKVKGYSQGTAELAGVDGERLESGLRKQLSLDSAPKTVVGKTYYPKVNKTLIKYSDGTEEAKDGRH